jgi:hypothetical protein
MEWNVLLELTQLWKGDSSEAVLPVCSSLAPSATIGWREQTMVLPHRSDPFDPVYTRGLRRLKWKYGDVKA